MIPIEHCEVGRKVYFYDPYADCQTGYAYITAVGDVVQAKHWPESYGEYLCVFTRQPGVTEFRPFYARYLYTDHEQARRAKEAK